MVQISEPTLEIGDTAAQLLADSTATSTPDVSGSVLVRLRGCSVILTLAAFPNTNPGQPSQEEAITILTLIAETDEYESVRDVARVAVEKIEDN